MKLPEIIPKILISITRLECYVDCVRPHKDIFINIPYYNGQPNYLKMRKNHLYGHTQYQEGELFLLWVQKKYFL